MHEDYPKFLKVVQDELPSSMWLQTTQTDPDNYKENTRPKMRHLYSCYENCQDGVKFHNGFQLDIFLYDKKKSNLVTTGQATTGDYKSYPIDMIFPLEEKMFEGIRVYIPPSI